MALSIPFMFLCAGFVATAKKMFFDIASKIMDDEHVTELKSICEDCTDLFAWFAETAMAFVGFEMLLMGKEIKTSEELATCQTEQLAKLIISYMTDPQGRERIQAHMKSRAESLSEIPWFASEDIQPFKDKLEELRAEVEADEDTKTE